MRKLSTILLAVALVLGLAQCKKEQPATPQSEGNVVTITLNVGDNNGSRVNVDPTGNQVTFTDGDQILVASGGKYVGTLTKNGTTFSGSVSEDDLVVGEPLYFYFLGNKADVSQLTAGSSTTCTVNISDQTTEAGLPVISMGRSIDSEGRIVKYVSGTTSFSSRLYNKCSLMKFNVTTPSTAAICIKGMYNTVTVNFGNPTDEGFSYSMNTEDGGLIKMPAIDANGETWAIVLPQPALTETGEAYTTDGYTGIRPEMDVIQMNKFLDAGFSMTVNTAPAPSHEYVDLGLPSGLLWATCNVGANAPEKYGDYFAWGETEPKATTYYWSNYRYCNGAYNTLTKYCTSSGCGYNGFTDNLTTLESRDDAATAYWGSDWRMPTKEEWEELLAKTTVAWTQQNSVDGLLFTAKNGSGNSLFLPAAGRQTEEGFNSMGGFYWSSSLSLYTDGQNNAGVLNFFSWGHFMANGYRYYGFSVRGVRSASKN